MLSLYFFLRSHSKVAKKTSWALWPLFFNEWWAPSDSASIFASESIFKLNFTSFPAGPAILIGNSCEPSTVKDGPYIFLEFDLVLSFHLTTFPLRYATFLWWAPRLRSYCPVHESLVNISFRNMV